MMSRYGQGKSDRGAAGHVTDKDYTPAVLHFISGIGGSLLVINVSLLLYVCHQRRRLRRLSSQQQYALHMHRTLLPHMAARKPQSREHNGKIATHCDSGRLNSEHCHHVLPDRQHNRPLTESGIERVTSTFGQSQHSEQHEAANLARKDQTAVTGTVGCGERDSALYAVLSSATCTQSPRLTYSSRTAAQYQWSLEDSVMRMRDCHLPDDSPDTPSTAV